MYLLWLYKYSVEVLLLYLTFVKWYFMLVLKKNVLVHFGAIELTLYLYTYLTFGNFFFLNFNIKNILTS